MMMMLLLLEPGSASVCVSGTTQADGRLLATNFMLNTKSKRGLPLHNGARDLPGIKYVYSGQAISDAIHNHAAGGRRQCCTLVLKHL